MARYSGKGWHFQSQRHSNAARTGKAGGKYSVTARAYNRRTGLPIGKERTEIINTKTNELFKKAKNEKDIKIEYESFWNDLNPNSNEIVKVKNIKTEKSKKHYGYSNELEPRNDSRKSFYGKARVETDGNKIKLYSYNTLVAEIIDGVPIVNNTYSATTLRHIKEFLKQNGFRAESGKQILKDYKGE